MPATKLRPHFTFDEDRLAKLRAIAPEAFVDGRVNWEVLQEALGEHLEADDEREHFGLFWPGKKDARRQAGVPPVGTLVPKPGEGMDEDTTRNIFIEGENLEVLKLLQKSYAGRVKMIYIDPPYNTGNDFVYDDNFTEGLDDYLRRTGMIDDEGRRLTTNSKADGRFHSKWLSMMFPRLRLARNLLRNDGVIFVSIDNNEVHNLRMLMNEVFGEENFVECITWNKRIPKNDKGIGSIHEYVLLYTKDTSFKQEFVMKKNGLEEIDELVERLKKQKVSLPESEAEIRKLYNKKGYDRGITLYNSLDKDYRLWGRINMSWPNANTFGPTYEVLHPKTKKAVKIPDRGWRWKEDTFNDAAKRVDGQYQDVIHLHDGTFMCGKIWFDKDEKTQPSSVNYLQDVDTFLLRSILSMKSDGGIEVEDLFAGKSFFSYPKPTALLKPLFSSVNTSSEIILDFFAGSATTAHAVMSLNSEDHGGRQFICVQLPEKVDLKTEAYKAGYKTISEISVERIRRAIKALKTSNDRDKKTRGNLFVDKATSSDDLGFKVFSLRHSNYKTWEDATHTDIAKLEIQFADATDPLVDGWKEADLLAEVMLLEGFPLDSRVALVDGVKGNRVHRITSDFHEHSLLVCLDKTVKPQTIASLALQPTDVLITLDSALTDEQKLTLGDKGMLRTI